MAAPPPEETMVPSKGILETVKELVLGIHDPNDYVPTAPESTHVYRDHDPRVDVQGPIVLDESGNVSESGRRDNSAASTGLHHPAPHHHHHDSSDVQVAFTPGERFPSPEQEAGTWVGDLPVPPPSASVQIKSTTNITQSEFVAQPAADLTNPFGQPQATFDKPYAPIPPVNVTQSESAAALAKGGGGEGTKKPIISAGVEAEEVPEEGIRGLSLDDKLKDKLSTEKEPTGKEKDIEKMKQKLVERAQQVLHPTPATVSTAESDYTKDHFPDENKASAVAKSEWDKVDEASWESFPASDPPAYW